jgi:hypothetical protein
LEKKYLEKLAPGYDDFFFADFKVFWVLCGARDLETVQQDVVGLTRVFQKVFLEFEGVIPKTSERD